LNRIQLLDNLTINKIAAGEVVERPSSVVKELIENSIDAGATSITVEVKDGGTTFIKISDNGCGIAKEQVKTAFLRHATSKIQYVEDLEKVHSLGFRGEALASIAAVSQVEITTKTAEDESGVTLKIEGGTVLDEENTASVTGTSITVKNLFFNVPARKKFLKKPATESGYITDVINKAALGHPEIAFKYINNGNLILHTPGSNDVRTVALFVFGKDFAKKMIELDYKDSTYKIFGLIGKPELSRANRSYEYLFINGRPVKSSIVSSRIFFSSAAFILNIAENTLLVFLRCFATRTFSKTVILLNKRIFWKVLAIPSFVIWSGVFTIVFLYMPLFSPAYSFFIFPLGKFSTIGLS